MNTHEESTVQQFVELRAQGATFAKIAEQLGVAKSTLIVWSRRHEHAIRNLRALEHEALAEKCRVSRRACPADLGEDLHRVREELARRSLEDIPNTKLLALAASLRAEAAKRGGLPQLSVVIPDGDLRNEMVPGLEVSWEA